MTGGNSILAKMAVMITANNAEFNRAMKQSSQQLNLLEGTINSTRNAIAGAFGAHTIYRGLEYGVKTMAQFEKQIDTVAAITGASAAEIKQLSDNAVNLAGAFKSIDIARMETELGRLGLSTKEIIDSTEAIINLATATGEDLAKSAETVGSTLRIYNLAATESGRVTDIMAGAFNTSALALDNFTEAIKYVGPVAHNAGLSLEQTSAMLGVLADSGIKGSMAGTSLRKIISDLGTGAAPVLAQKLKEMAAAGLSGADAMDEVGRTAYASLLVLANNTEKVMAQTEALQKMNGTAAETASIMEDNLIGDWNKFTAALDATIISGSGVIGTLRDIVHETRQVILFLGEAFGMHELWTADVQKEKLANRPGPMPAKHQQFQWGFLPVTSNISGASEPSIRQQSLAANKDFKAPATAFAMQEYEASLIKALAAQDQFAASNLELSTTFGQSVGAVQNYMNTLGDEAKWEGIRNNMATTAEQTEAAAMRMANAMYAVGDAIGDALVGSIQTGESFVQGLMKQTDRIVNQLYRQAVAWMVAKSIANGSPFPLANIAIATAGVIGVRALFAGVKSGGGGAPSPSVMTRGEFRRSSSMGNYKDYVEFKISGANLVGTMNNYNRSSGRTGN